MKNINSIAPFHREKILEKARAIADYNKKHFFSKEFQGLIESELAENFAQAFNEIEERNTGQCWLEQHKKIYGQPTVRKLLDQLDYTGTPEQIDTVTKRAQEYYIRTLKHNT